MKLIEIHSHYVKSGNIFSKQILLQQYLEKNRGPVLYIVSDEKYIQQQNSIAHFLGNSFQSLDNFAQLIDISYNKIGFYCIDTSIFQRQLPHSAYDRENNIYQLDLGVEINIDTISKQLHNYGYLYNEYKNSGSFYVQGDTLHITNIGATAYYQISFWGNTIENISIILNNASQTVLEKNTLFIGKNKKISDFEFQDTYQNNSAYLFRNITTIYDEIDFYNYEAEVTQNTTSYIQFHHFSQNSQKNEISLNINDLYLDTIDDFTKLLHENTDKNISIYTKNFQTIRNFLDYNNIENIQLIESKNAYLKSFQSHNNITICDDNISRIFIKKRVHRSTGKQMDLLMQIKAGDYIVHVDHGIGIFQQILEKQLLNSQKKTIKKEYIELLYKNNDKLFVPITEVNRLSKYIGGENPKLTGLSTQEWEKKLKKINENVEEIAHEILESYAQRALEKGFQFLPQRDEEKKFFQSFEYNYTDDQYRIIQDIYQDMESEKPMDRLVSGDVGFGKTEIAFSAIFKAVSNGKQAAFISPLVVLAYEHYEKTLSRFQSFPFNVGILTRFETEKSIKDTLEKLQNGKIDIIIGTHKLLSEQVKFKDLGLLVIDEEHKFGVKDKDKIKSIRQNIDILSLSATPIPRSLNMALNGIKSMSMLTTPPLGRQPIDTIVSGYDESLIQSVGQREFDRNGQLFFIHNKVTTIENQKIQLEKIFPGKKIIVAHGQLPGDQLEKRILSFKKKEYDILLATTVIENGIDFSNVNTIIINEAHNFGISQIHQLRGRVGRSQKKGYCYLLFQKDKIKDEAAKRLRTIVEYSHLGAGFELAIKDLEIRGGGDILGLKQSGQQTEVGINLYLEMLENKIEELKRTGLGNKSEIEIKKQKINTSIDLQISAYVDDSYFQSELDKINFYREIESLESGEDLSNIIQDFKDLNPNHNLETLNFFDLLEVKLQAAAYQIVSIRRVGINYQIEFADDITVDDLKEFLKLDTEIMFEIHTLQRIRANVKKFQDEESFLQYLKNIFSKTKPQKKKKIKLKKKA